MAKIYNNMKNYKKTIYPFHMPGHKRIARDIFSGIHPYEVDFTEIDHMDDLHEPEEMFRDLMDEMKDFYGSKESFLLVNGSTSGIMAAIATCCDLGDSIIVGRNCHKSVYMAMELLALKPIYLYPEMEKENGTVTHIDLEKVKEIVDKHRDAKAFVLTSPTYEGKTMEVEKISAIVKEAGMYLIVDEAHGAHFPFGKYFPTSALSKGADLVIQSMHKTMPALTQTALLHLSKDSTLTAKKVQECIDYFETTSPSYLLMASIADAFSFGKENAKIFDEYFYRLQDFRQKMGRLKHLHLLPVDDVGKLVISTANTNMTGKQLYDILLETYGLQMEMVQETYCLAMTSVCDTKEGYLRLEKALFEIDGRLEEKKGVEIPAMLVDKEQIVIPYRAKRMKKISLRKKEALGKVSAEYIYLYPPGIPLIVPGEKINQGVLDKIEEYKQKHLKIKGLEDKGAEHILVLNFEA